MVGMLLSSTFTFAQGEIDSLPRALIRNEYSLAGLLYSNGWGLELVYGKMKNIKKKSLYSFDFAVVYDPKEIKISNPSSSKYSRFVYGKTHSLINIRVCYGNQRRFYQKMDKGGIEVRGYYRIGAVIGFLKPIYYEIGSERDLEKFSSGAHVSALEIYGKANYFKGFSEMSVVPGLHLKGALSFEFGKKDRIINAIEGGVSVDVFPKEMELMANEYNDFYFLSVFLCGRIGKIVNPRMKLLENK